MHAEETLSYGSVLITPSASGGTPPRHPDGLDHDVFEEQSKGCCGTHDSFNAVCGSLVFSSLVCAPVLCVLALARAILLAVWFLLVGWWWRLLCASGHSPPQVLHSPPLPS